MAPEAEYKVQPNYREEYYARSKANLAKFDIDPQDSSLCMRIMGIMDIRQQYCHYPRNLVLPEPHASKIRIAADDRYARILIALDPEFIDLASAMYFESQESSFKQQLNPELYEGLIDRSLDAYGDALSNPNPSLFGIAVLAQPVFRKYMIEATRDNGALGPIFSRILKGLETADMDVAQAIVGSLGVFRVVEHAYFWLMDRGIPPKGYSFDDTEVPTNLLDPIYERELAESKNARHALVSFKDAIDNVLSIAFDRSDSSEWRKYVLENIDRLLLEIGHIGSSESYDGSGWLKSIELAFKLGQESDDPDFLPRVMKSIRYFDLPNCAIFLTFLRSSDKERLEQVMSFQEEILGSKVHDLKVRFEFVNYWIKKYSLGEISFDTLHALSKQFREYTTLMKELTDSDINPNTYKVRRLLQGEYDSTILYSEAMLSLDFVNIRRLFMSGTYPTESILEFVRTSEGDGVENIQKIKELIKSGKFDRENPLHRDIEFFDYLQLCDYEKATRSDFDSLPYESVEKKTRQLTEHEEVEVEVAAFEAANLYWQIKELVEAGRDITVVGNKRYGAYFVVRPLLEHLQELGVEVTETYMRSSGADASVMDVMIFDPNIEENILRNAPDVVIVDGTSTPISEGKSRFSSSTWRFINWFSALNNAAGQDYTQLGDHNSQVYETEAYKDEVARLQSMNPKSGYYIRQWNSHGVTENIFFGKETTIYSALRYKGDPQVIIANPIFPAAGNDRYYPPRFIGHTPAYFDDPEKIYNTGERKVVLSKYGVTILKDEIEEDAYVRMIGEHIKKAIPEMILKTDPRARLS